MASGSLADALAKSVVSILHVVEAALRRLDTVECPVHPIAQESNTSECVHVGNEVRRESGSVHCCERVGVNT